MAENKRWKTETGTHTAGFRLKGLALRVAGNRDAKIILSGKKRLFPQPRHESSQRLSGPHHLEARHSNRFGRFTGVWRSTYI